MALGLVESPTFQPAKADHLGGEIDGHEPHREGGGPDEAGTRIQKNTDQEYPDPLEQVQLHRRLVPQMTLDGAIPVLPAPSHHVMMPARQRGSLHRGPRNPATIGR